MLAMASTSPSFGAEPHANHNRIPSRVFKCDSSIRDAITGIASIDLTSSDCP
jgi:hypothetical protein